MRGAEKQEHRKSQMKMSFSSYTSRLSICVVDNFKDLEWSLGVIIRTINLKLLVTAGVSPLFVQNDCQQGYFSLG